MPDRQLGTESIIQMKSTVGAAHPRLEAGQMPLRQAAAPRSSAVITANSPRFSFPRVSTIHTALSQQGTFISRRTAVESFREEVGCIILKMESSILFAH